MFAYTHPKTQKIPTVNPTVRRGKTVGIAKCRIHLNRRNSYVTQRGSRIVKRVSTKSLDNEIRIFYNKNSLDMGYLTESNIQ